jgi:hypothetical protein
MVRLKPTAKSPFGDHASGLSERLIHAFGGSAKGDQTLAPTLASSP